MKYIKFKNEAIFDKWDEAQFNEYYLITVQDDPDTGRTDSDAKHGKKILGYKNGVLNETSGFTEKWVECITNENNSFVLATITSARTGFSDIDILTKYQASLITEEDAVQQGLIPYVEEII